MRLLLSHDDRKELQAKAIDLCKANKQPPLFEAMLSDGNLAALNPGTEAFKCCVLPVGESCCPGLWPLLPCAVVCWCDFVRYTLDMLFRRYSHHRGAGNL